MLTVTHCNSFGRQACMPAGKKELYERGLQRLVATYMTSAAAAYNLSVGIIGHTEVTAAEMSTVSEHTQKACLQRQAQHQSACRKHACRGKHSIRAHAESMPAEASTASERRQKACLQRQARRQPQMSLCRPSWSPVLASLCLPQLWRRSLWCSA